MAHQELHQSFLQEAEDVMLQLEQGVDALDTAAREGGEVRTAQAVPGMAQVSLLAHRMRGSAGLYGFQQLSTLAGLLERLLDARPDLSGEQGREYLALLQDITRELRGGLITLNAGGTDRDLGLNFARSGAPARLQGLVATVPDAFQMRAALHRAPEHDDTHTPEVTGLEGQLQTFAAQNAEVWEYFAPEVHEHIAALRQALDDPAQADANTMFRAAHTIKGSSYMVGLQELGDFAHGMEDLLGAVRSEAVPLNTGVQDALSAGVDLLDDMMLVAGGGNVLQDGSVTLQGRLDDLGAQLRRLATGEAPAIAPAVTAAPARTTLNATIRVPAQRLEGLMEQLVEVVGSRARLTAMLTQLDEMQGLMQDSQARFQRTVRDFEERYLNPDMVRTLDSGRENASAGTDTPGLTAGFADLEFDTYDDLNILSRSITELSVDFGEVRKRLSDTVAGLIEENESLGKLIRQLRTDLNATSRVPFSQATARLRRWAREQQEHLALNIEGDDVLVESGILQRLTDPLLHLLTNAAHHGLRRAYGDPHSRVAQGKPAVGQVFIRAAESANFLEVTVADDGDGLNLERVRERALAAGVGSAQELAAMSDADAARLILLPGLSTAETVGQTAGRGVGMDVVANSVRSLGGELVIQSEPGVGTAFVLRLPTTQRIMDVLDVQLSTQDWGAFAVNTVQALRDVPERELVLIEGAPHVRFEGQHVPVVDARPFWGPVAELGAFDDEAHTAHLVFASSISGTVAVRVMAFGRIDEVSVTPPSPLLGRLEYLSGLTVGATGTVLPILDPAGLLRLARRPDAWLSGQVQGAQASSRTLLLVDDSVSVRRLVSRMLERAGFHVLTANDGQEGLDAIHADGASGSGGRIDAVITDLEMPRMNGYELLSAIRGRSGSETLPVLVMTTRAGEKHQQLAFSMGANDYFTKPVNENLLLRRLQVLLGTLDATPGPVGSGR